MRRYNSDNGDVKRPPLRSRGRGPRANTCHARYFIAEFLRHGGGVARKGNPADRKNAANMSRCEQALPLGRVRVVAGLAAAVVPFAILVHLVAEALSLGRDALSAAFVIRHLYLCVVLLGTSLWFGRTVGVGCNEAERRRRCALIRAQLRGAAAGWNFASIALAHIAFFGSSQLVEGVPVASGHWCIGLGAALLGSLVFALFVLLFGRSLIIAALEAIEILLRQSTARTKPNPVGFLVISRRASSAFSLFVPNRPPPTRVPRLTF